MVPDRHLACRLDPVSLSPVIVVAFLQSRHGYELWQQSQRNHLGDLANKFWHFSLPVAKSSRQIQEARQHHCHYQLLLHKLLRSAKGVAG